MKTRSLIIAALCLTLTACGTVIVTVEETTPAPDATVTEAFTYPNCAITFSYEPPDGILIQTADGIAFEDLGTTTEP